MDKLSEKQKKHHLNKFNEHGATAKGVDWNDEEEYLFRNKKLLELLNNDFDRPSSVPKLLDVGCGWGGLYKYCLNNNIKINYTGIDIVESMINYAKKTFPKAKFETRNVYDLGPDEKFDYVICNGILTQKLDVTIPEMNALANRIIIKMFELCNYGLAFNLMSNRVNFMVNNLYYRSPVELLEFCLSNLSPRVKLDHGYSSLASGRGKYYDYTIFVYKN